MYSNLEGSYGEDRKFRYYFLGTAYIFLFAALTTTLEYVIIFYGEVLPHEKSYNTTYYALTAVGLIPLTIISAVHIFDGWEKCGMFEVGCLINATAFGIFTGISCIYGCDTPALPIAFGYVCLISFITYLLILLFPSCYLITTGIMIGVGLAGSIAYFIVFWKIISVPQLTPQPVMTTMVVSIVIFIVLGIFAIVVYKCDNSHFEKRFYAGNYAHFVITAPATGALTLAVALVIGIFALCILGAGKKGRRRRRW